MRRGEWALAVVLPLVIGVLAAVFAVGEVVAPE